MGDISSNFSRSEFVCKDGCGLSNVDLRLMPIMELIRHHEGDKSMVPNSACRCIKHNEKIQLLANPNYIAYSSGSKHLPNVLGVCTAVDIRSDDPIKLYKFLDSLFPYTYGIGVYSWGIHIDTRFNKARWDRR